MNSFKIFVILLGLTLSHQLAVAKAPNIGKEIKKTAHKAEGEANKEANKIEDTIKKVMDNEIRQILQILKKIPYKELISLVGDVINPVLKQYNLTVQEVIDAGKDVLPLMKKEFQQVKSGLASLKKLKKACQGGKNITKQKDNFENLRTKIEQSMQDLKGAKVLVLLGNVSTACSTAPEVVLASSLPSVGQGVTFVCNNAAKVLKDIDDLCNKVETELEKMDAMFNVDPVAMATNLAQNKLKQVSTGGQESEEDDS